MAKNGNTNIIQIDGERLRKAIMKRSVSIYDAGVAINRSKSYIGSVMRSGRIHKAAVKDLAETYGIALAEYEKREEAETEEKTTETEDLKAIIAEAVLEALKRYPHEVIAAEMEKWREKR